MSRRRKEMYLQRHVREAIQVWGKLTGGDIPHHVQSRPGGKRLVRGYGHAYLPAEVSPQLRALAWHRSYGHFSVTFIWLEIDLHPVGEAGSVSFHPEVIGVGDYGMGEFSPELREELVGALNRRIQQSLPLAWEEKPERPLEPPISQDEERRLLEPGELSEEERALWIPPGTIFEFGN